jgi:hypothetical protein
VSLSLPLDSQLPRSRLRAGSRNMSRELIDSPAPKHVLKSSTNLRTGLSSGKLVLILMLFCFTFITMVGCNPKHDAYGFRYWRDPVRILPELSALHGSRQMVIVSSKIGLKANGRVLREHSLNMLRRGPLENSKAF